MRLTFLTYSSRSGSTFLAKQIADSGPVLVVPEMQCPYLLLSRPFETQVDPEQFDRLVREDVQITWPVPTPGMPITVADSIHHLVAAYADYRNYGGQEALIKLGGLPMLDERARRHLGALRYINIVRDGRAVSNSLLAAKSPYLGGGLSIGYGDVVWSARRWRDDVAVEMSVLDEGPQNFILVRYEELIVDAVSVTTRVFDQAGWTLGEPTGFQVGIEEESIHPNVADPGMYARVDAWRLELGRENRIVVESYAGTWLNRLGYDDRLDVSVYERLLVLLKANLCHYVIQCRAVFLRLRRIRGLAHLRDKIRYVAARRGKAL